MCCCENLNLYVSSLSKPVPLSGFDPVISSFRHFITGIDHTIKDCDYAGSQSLDELMLFDQLIYEFDYANYMTQ